MTNNELSLFIVNGLKAGKSPEALQLEAAQLFNCPTEQFSQVLNQVILDTSPSETPPVPQIPAKRGYFKWFTQHKIASSILVVVGLIVAGGITFATQFLPPNINTIGELVYERLENMTTVEYTGTLQAEVTSDAFLTLNNVLQYGPQRTYPENPKVAGSTNTKARLDFNGAVDIRNVTEPKNSLSFTLSTEGIVIGAETITLGESEGYFRVTQLPTFGAFDFSQFLNQWYRVDAKDLENLPGAAPVENELTVEQEQRISEVLKKYRIFRVAEKLQSEEVDGVNAHHYRYTIDEASLVAAFEEIIQIVAGTESEILDVATKEQILDWLDIKGGEVWISKKDYSPLKLTFEVNLRSVTDAPVTGKLNMELKFKNYNKDIKIEAPSDYKNLVEVIQSFMEEELAPSVIE